MLISAIANTGLRTTSVRPGVLYGDRSRCWNPNDLFPLLFKSAPQLGCIFDMDEVRNQFTDPNST